MINDTPSREFSIESLGPQEFELVGPIQVIKTKLKDKEVSLRPIIYDVDVNTL